MRAVLLLAAVALSGATAARAQVDPAADFDVGWRVEAPDGDRYTFRAVVASRRDAAATLDFTVALQRTGASANASTIRQTGLLTTPPGGVDTAGRVTVALAPGDRVEARLTLRHLQEGWVLLDTFARTFGTAPAAQPSPTLAADPDFLEIDGLVIDRVLTKPGRDFYELFYRDWDAPFGARGYSILVEETPFRGRQTIIKVSVDEQLIYQQILQTRYDVLEEMVQQAVAIASSVLRQRTQAEAAGESDFVEQY